MQCTTRFYTHLLLKNKKSKLQHTPVSTFPPLFLPLQIHASCDLEIICGTLELKDKHFEIQQQWTEGNPSDFSHNLKSPARGEVTRIPMDTPFRSRPDCSRNSTEASVILAELVPEHPNFLVSICESKTWGENLGITHIREAGTTCHVLLVNKSQKKNDFIYSQKSQMSLSRK